MIHVYHAGAMGMLSYYQVQPPLAMKKITGICGRIMSIHRSNYSCEGKPGRSKRPGFFIP